jgi:GDPmannose 4,6-dehydratase
MNTALITGITGQDASYLSEFLLEKNYKVVGIKRRTSTNTLDRIGHIKDDIEIIDGDISDASSITGIISHYKPDEIYNLAAQSHVGISFNQPSYTFDVNTVGLINIL